jgi:SAM-dependent methyltransferase
MAEAVPRLYGEFAAWFHLLTAPPDYAEEAARGRQIIESAVEGEARTLLELGSGGGNNASHLKQWFTCTLTDLAPEMLAVSRALNPECEHVQGDMRSLRLGREFDCVFVHDAVMYMTSGSSLRAAMETAYAHTRPGGVAIFLPDCTRETFRERTSHGGHDGPDGRALRYVEWTTDPDPSDTEYSVDFAYLLREPGGGVRVEQDRHIFGLFRRDEWVRWLEEAGFAVRIEAMGGDDAREAFAAKRPRAQS